MSKHHALGNDFLIALDERNGGPLPLDGDDAVRLCDRRRGIGADGLIRAAREPGIDAVMTLWNSDGGRAEISGNGLRCLVQALARQRGVEGATFAIRTDAGERRARVLGGSTTDASMRIDAEMGSVLAATDERIAAAELAVRELIAAGRIGVASVGNPHVVVEVADPAAVDLATIGPRLEAALQANIEVIAALDRERIGLRVWERGAGLTEACGSGACAGAYWAHTWGLTGSAVSVEMPGGSAMVSVAEPMLLDSPVTHVADIEVPCR